VKKPSYLQFEHKGEKVAPPAQFLRRMVRALGLWLLLTASGLALGMAGYMLTEGMSALDAFLNAAMILSGMGPVDQLHSTAGKAFAGMYAIFSGLFVVIASGFALAPVLHRVLHAFHVEGGKDKDD
jgi:hypothetical protein